MSSIVDADNGGKKSTAVAESADSLRQNLVIDQKDEILHKSTPDHMIKEGNDVDSGDDEKASSAAVQTMLTATNAALKVADHSNCKITEDSEDKMVNTVVQNTLDTKNAITVDQAVGGLITLVKTGSQTYTKIMPANHSSHPLISQSVRDAFSAETTFDSHNSENRSKRLKENPHLQHLLPHNKIKPKQMTDSGFPHKSPLLRSTSMPVCVESEFADEDACHKHAQGEKGSFPLHRTIFRTGSISDYTKQKLKTSILMRTSASLVRKPSITEQEMRQIQTDIDSSQSDDDEEEPEEAAEIQAQFKSADVTSERTAKKTNETNSLTGSAGSVDNCCRDDVINTSVTPAISSLSGTNVSLAIAITTA